MHGALGAGGNRPEGMSSAQTHTRTQENAMAMFAEPQPLHQPLDGHPAWSLGDQLDDRTLQALNSALAVLVEGKDGRLVRRVFLSLPPAMRADQRARERGQRATLTLCRLLPVHMIVAPAVQPGGTR